MRSRILFALFIIGIALLLANTRICRWHTGSHRHHQQPGWPNLQCHYPDPGVNDTLTVLPALLLTMTSFTRIVIVLSLLRQALGTGQAPSNQVLLGLSLFLTIFIMMPVFDKVNTDAVQPYLEEKMDVTTALEKASAPFRQFMLKQTRESDLEMFIRISGNAELASADDVPFSLLMSAFVTSELKTAFQIGFLIFLPFLIIDLVVASVLMSMGMMMLSPMIISLPFKIMLFVLADGWSLIMEMLAASFYVS